jgi:hypothetical protein
VPTIGENTIVINLRERVLEGATLNSEKKFAEQRRE